MTTPPTFVDEHHLRVGDVDFHFSFRPGDREEVPDGFLRVAKSRDQIERYLRLAKDVRPEVIVELGVFWGGSTALLHALFRPKRLVAIEFAPDAAPALTAYIRAHGLEAVIRPHYGIDQADRDALAAVMATELAGQPIDLIVDDASHRLEETRTSFESLFPRLRPGGLFVIEDWESDQWIVDQMLADLADPTFPNRDVLLRNLEQAPPQNPASDARLVRLPLELVLARARKGDVIREVTVMENWVIVRRGEQPSDPSNFRLSELVRDHFANLRPLR